MSYCENSYRPKLSKLIFIALCLFPSLLKADSSLLIPENCLQLKEPKRTEDLLYQFYQNKDTDCLFKISTDALQRIWKIPVLDFRQSSKKIWEREENQSNYLEAYSNLGQQIKIVISEKYGGQNFHIIHKDMVTRPLFVPASSFPQSLPEPESFYSPWTAIGAAWIKDKDYGDYKAYHVYAWHGRYATIYLESNNATSKGPYGFNFMNSLLYPKHNF